MASDWRNDEMSSPSAVGGDGLRSFLDALIEKGAPPPPPKLTVPAISRRWSPKEAPPGPYPAARVYWRHPNLALFEDAETKLPPNSRRAPSAGIRRLPFSRKNGMAMLCLNRIESGLFEDLEVDWAVDAFLARPISIRTSEFGRFKPSFYAQRGAEHWFLVCTDEEAASSKEDRWARLAAEINALGIGLEVFTERHVLKGVRAHNVADIQRSRGQAPVPIDIARAVMAFSGHAPNRNELAQAVPGLSKMHLRQLAAVGLIRFDLSEDISLARFRIAAVDEGVLRHAIAAI